MRCRNNLVLLIVKRQKLHKSYSFKLKTLQIISKREQQTIGNISGSSIKFSGSPSFLSLQFDQIAEFYIWLSQYIREVYGHIKKEKDIPGLPEK